MPQPLQTAGQLRAPLFLAAAAIIAMASPPAYAEGSAQTGANQALFVDPFDINVDTVLNVYVAELGEVINISAGNSDGQNVYVTIVNPAGTTVVDDELLTPARGELAGDLPDCAQDIPNPFQYVTGTDVTDTADDADPADTSDGQYVITFRVGANDDSLETATIYPYDITVTDDASEAVFHCAADGDGDGFIDQEPTQAYKGGRLHSARWSFNAGAYDNATDADFFILVPGGRPQESYVWLLDLNGLAGYWYDISGNYTGVDSPDADGVAVAGFSVPEEGNSVTPMFEIYLAHPEEAFSPGAPPTLTGFRFRDDALVDNSISPGNEDGIQDEGNFYFTSDVEGTYAIFIDGDDNGIFDPTMPGDILLSGRASEGLNSVYFDGRDNTGAPMNPGVHMARMSLRAGEYHFVGRDIESSLPGIRILDANDPGVIRPGTMYWNDTLLASTETFNPVEAYPDGLSSGEYADAPAIGVNTHSWGTQDENSESNETYIDTYVFGAEDTGVQRVVVTSGSNANISTSTMTVTVDGGGTAGPGSTMIYTVTFINTSTIDDATDVTFTNLIPDGVTLVPGSLTCTDAAATTAEGSTLTVEGLTVPAGTGADAPGTVVCTYSVTVDDGTTGTISNQGSFTWDGGAVGGLTDGDADTPELETTDITIGGSGGTDTDGDGLSDDEEELIGTDPNDPDTDGDGLTDGDETGMDGMYDEGTDTDPNDPDTDGDGLSDGDEVTTYGTDPLDPDTDGGGVSDGDEVLLWQTDPLDAADDDEYAYSGGSCATVQPGADGGGWLLLFAVFALTFF